MYIEGREQAIKWAKGLRDDEVVVIDAWGEQDIEEMATDLHGDKLIPRMPSEEGIKDILFSLVKDYDIEAGFTWDIVRDKILDHGNGRAY